MGFCLPRGSIFFYFTKKDFGGLIAAVSFLRILPGETVMDAWAMGEKRRYEFRLQYVKDRWHLFRIFEDVPDPNAKPIFSPGIRKN